MAQVETVVEGLRPSMSFKRGYSSVGKNIFAIDTDQLRSMREANAAKKQR